MAKKRIQSYIFTPGVSGLSNAFPNAYSLIDSNIDFIVDETTEFLDAQIIIDTAVNLLPNAVALLTANKTFLQEELVVWIAEQVATNQPGFAGYTYDSAKCKRDVGYVLDSYIYDLRYGGNEQTRAVASVYWVGTTPQIDGNRLSEVYGHAKLALIINDYVFTKTVYPTAQAIATQVTSGTAGEAGAAARITTLSTIVTSVIQNGLTSVPAISYGTTFTNYTYNAAFVRSDIEVLIPAILWDLRYGGNRNTKEGAEFHFWLNGIPQINGNRTPEVATYNFIKNLVNNYIIKNLAFTSLQTPAVTTQTINLALTLESGSEAALTTLFGVVTTIILDGPSAAPTLVNGVGTINIGGKWTRDQLLLITDVTNNTILYNFADPTAGVTLTERAPTSPDEDTEIEYGTTRITLSVDTQTMSSTDALQIFVEDFQELRTRPYDFGTDAIERNRMSQAQSMLDADFEYGLQPTKWQALSLARSYPSVYEIPGTDTVVTLVTTDASAGTGGTGQSLITVTTNGAHGLQGGSPFIIRALSTAVTGFSRAEGVFLVSSTPSSTQFTYYAKAKVGTISATELQESYTLLRRGGLYTGADLGTPTFSVYNQGSSGTFFPALNVAAGSTTIPYTGSIPVNNAPVTASGAILTGAVITSVIGSGSSGSTAYTALSGINISGIGVNAVFTVTRTSAVYTVTITTAGTGYAIGDQIGISGTDLEGTSPGNDCLITVATVGATGDILTLTSAGSGIASGVAASQTLSDTSPVGSSVLEFTDTTGIQVGLAVDRGDNTSTIVTNIEGTTVTLSSPLTSAKIGDAAEFSNVAPTSIVGSGTGVKFDVTRVGTLYTPTVTTGQLGTGYVVGDTLTIAGTALAGIVLLNDLTITVTTIGVGGTVTGITSSGIGSDQQIYTSRATTRVTGLGTSAVFSVTRVGVSYTAVTPTTAGSGYVVGDLFEILGTDLGGTSPANDLSLTVDTVNGSGGITTVTFSGIADPGTATYATPATDPTALPALIGTGATFSVVSNGTVYTPSILNSGDATRTARVTAATGGTQASSTQTRFGSGSLRIPNALSPTAASSYATITSDVGLEFGTGDFTIDFWFRPDSVGVNQTLVDMRNAATDTAVVLGFNASNNAYLFVNGTTRITGTDSVSAETWYHLELSRSSGFTELFLNGQSQGTWTDSTTYALRPAVIGADYLGAGDGFLGFIDEFRISKGIARHTAGFTVATSPYTNDSNTTALLHFNESTGATAFGDDIGGYAPGNQFVIRGTELGGATPANDLTITVLTITADNKLLSISGAGTALDDDIYTTLSGTLLTGNGSGLTLNVSTAGTVYSNVTTGAVGSGYVAGDKIKVVGTLLGGAAPANDLTIQIVTVDGSGAVGIFTVLSGTANASSASYSALTPTNTVTKGTGLTVTIGKAGGSYTFNAVEGSGGDNYVVGNRLQVLGDVLAGAVVTHDLTLTVTEIDTSGSVVNATVAGTSSGGQSIDFYSTVVISEPTTAVLTTISPVTFAAIAVIQVTFTSNHGLVPGAGILVNITSAALNQNLAAGPFFVEAVPLPTVIRYTARAQGSINEGGFAGIIYTRSDTFFSHRPYDGGVQLGTGGPQHGAQAVRMSKNYIRYQSGKGLMYTTGALFAPSYDLLLATSSGLAVGSIITFTTDDVDHGLQVGADVRIIGVDTSGYNNDYVVSSIISERVFTVVSTQQLSATTATLSSQAQISLYRWSGATVRAGCFDDQNGMFWQYNGQRLAVTVRSSTFQLAGSVTATPNSNLLTGTNTRFRDQLKAGDKIVIKGMTHTVTSVPNQTTLYMNPDYRGANVGTKIKLCRVQDRFFYQESWNRDSADGTGPSGYNIDITKMQMIGIQYTWYGAGFIDYMLRGREGNFLFVHRVRNNNVNTEAFMRSANLPVRYEVVNDGALAMLSSDMSAASTTIPLDTTEDFPNTGTVYIDNEMISYTSKTTTSLGGLTRSAPLSNFTAGATRTYTAGDAASHATRTGVIFISNKTSPVISHWGSAYLTDGGFDTDRGYLFNYQATSFIATTARKTAFLIRLAPSVSNAIVGDLGDRELINRAQLLLQGIEVTAGTGTASGIVLEGVLNPSNYPVNPTLIDWRSLQNPSAGGQPSFAQVALGTSVTWNNLFTVSFDSVTATYGVGNGFYYAEFLASEVANVRVGMVVTSVTTAIQAVIPGGTTVSYISGTFNRSGTNYVTIYFNKNFTGSIPVGSSFSFSSIATFASPGETIFSFVGLPNNQTSLNLGQLKEITNTAIGGRGVYPNGPDVLAINCYLTGGNQQEVSIVLRWSEAQA
jgi:hypothetical protein